MKYQGVVCRLFIFEPIIQNPIMEVKMATKTVDNLMKVHLLFKSGTGLEKMDLTSKPVEYSFVFGTGSEGLTPFEYEIINKTVGDEVCIFLNQAEIVSKLKHMASFITENLTTHETFYLWTKVVSITAADNREIVKALSENIKNAHGCNCGCGCNNHS